MALTLGDNFSYQGAKPLDGRLKYDTVANMKAVADATMYDGCLAYCVATDKTYQWKSTNTVDETTGKWREFSSGGGGGTSDYTDLTNKPSINNVTLSGNKTTSDLNISYNDLTNKPTIPSITNCYQTGDTAETSLADNDYVPFYDTSATAKRKTLWSNIKSVLKTYFDTVYQGVITAGTGLSKSSNTLSVKPFESGDIAEIMTPLPSSAPKYHVYSTEEQVVGQWVDGSTIYEKSFAGIMPSTLTSISFTDVPLDTAIGDIALIETKGAIRWSEGGTNGWNSLITMYWLGNSNSTTSVLVNRVVQSSAVVTHDNGLYLRFVVGYSNAIFQSQPYHITVQYIKTT